MALVSAICCCNSLRVAPAAAQGLNVSSSLHVKSSSRNRCTLNVVAFGLRSSNSIAEYTCNTLASSFSENANVSVAFSEENNAEEFQKRNYQREGVSLKPWASNPRRGAVKVRAGKTALGCTKRSRSRKSRARTQGFRVRMQTPGGRRVLKRRRAKGRKVLVPQSNPSSGKRA